jgi:hypothetical protein
MASLARGRMMAIEHCSETGDDNGGGQGMKMGDDIKWT